MESKKIRVLVVDDSAIIRRAITQVVEETPDIEIAALAVDGKEAIRSISNSSRMSSRWT